MGESNADDLQNVMNTGDLAAELFAAIAAPDDAGIPSISELHPRVNKIYLHMMTLIAHQPLIVVLLLSFYFFIVFMRACVGYILKCYCV